MVRQGKGDGGVLSSTGIDDYLPNLALILRASILAAMILLLSQEGRLGHQTSTPVLLDKCRSAGKLPAGRAGSLSLPGPAGIPPRGSLSSGRGQ